MGFPLKKENAYFLLVDEDEDDKRDRDKYEYLDRSHSLASILLVLVLFDVEADFNESALLNAYVEQVEDLVDVDVEDVTAKLVCLKLVAQAAKEEEEQPLQVGCEADYLQEFEVVLPTFDAADRPLDPGLQWLALGDNIEVDSH